MGWVERQLPEGDEVFLDHVGFFVNDIEAVRAPFERLGFQATPVNIHYNSDAKGNLTKSGTANRLCTFHIGYIEVLAAVADTPLADQLKASLARYTGLHLIAFTHSDVTSRESRLQAAGFDLQPTVRLRRPVQTPNGEKTVKVTVVRTKPGVFSEGRVQMLTHESPALIWLPGYSAHPNRADALTDLLVVSEDSIAKSEQYAQFTGCTRAEEGDLTAVLLSRGRLTFATPAAAEAILPGFLPPSLPYTAAVAIRSADLKDTRRAFKARGIKPAADNDKILCIGPDDGVGAYIIFHARDVETVWPHLTR